MKIAILSNGSGNYSTKRLKEEAENRGHEVEIIAYKKCYVSIDEKNPKVMYKGEEIDTESETVIEPALDYFKNLQIPKSLAKEVGSFYMDGGNEVYMNIIPQWDGEDGYFDLNDVSLTELRQFPNLTEATILTDDFDKIKKIFDAAGIKVELL